jgi:hypothetical protein
MIATTATDVALSISTTLSAAVVILAIALARIHARVVRLEEWVRRYEKEEFANEP